MRQAPLVLIIDDDDAPREMLADFCDTLGCQSFTCRSTEEAESYLASSPLIDLVILDLILKGKSSLGFVDTLKSSAYAEVPIIIISGGFGPDHVREALSKGVFDFVAKPFTLQQMRDRVEQALKSSITVKQQRKYYTHVEELLRERTAMLEDLAFQSVRALVNSIEARDPYTRGHSERVAFFSTKIAERMGLADETVTKINLAGLLHDVGKVGIPDRILLKPGKLSEFEFSIMKEHPNMSALIVSEISPLKGIVEWIKGHHERFDGTGYPEHLSGQGIPVEAQIIAIADNFDALSSVRPYRRQLDKATVIGYIESEFGKKFDPQLREVSVGTLEDLSGEAEERSMISPIVEKFRESMVYMDFLTGLYWYPYLKSFLTGRIRKKQRFFLILVELHGLRDVNQRMGRMHGDRMLIRSANALQSAFVTPSIVTRSGGNDFIIYEPHAPSEAEITKKLEVLKGLIKEEQLEFTAQVVSYPQDGDTMERLIASME